MTAHCKLTSVRSIAECLEKVSELLTEEGVRFNRSINAVYSTETPVALLSVDRKLYSRNNWMGINPFIFISKIDILCRDKNNESGTDIDVDIDWIRCAVIFCFFFIILSMVAIALPSNNIAFLLSTSGLLIVLLYLVVKVILRQEIVKKIS